MTDKTMPERIYVKPYKQDGCYRLCSDDQTERGDVEYVRADLAKYESASSVPPLEADQFRWVKHGGAWCVATTHKSVSSERIQARVGMKISVDVRELEELGPLVRPPEDDCDSDYDRRQRSYLTWC